MVMPENIFEDKTKKRRKKNYNLQFGTLILKICDQNLGMSIIDNSINIFRNIKKKINSSYYWVRLFCIKIRSYIKICLSKKVIYNKPNIYNYSILNISTYLV